MKPRLLKAWSWLRRSGTLTLILLVVVSLSVRSAIADWNDVPSGSMKPTILIGDRIFVNKLAYDLKVPFTRVRLATWNHPDRGDIVICWSPADGARLVKRVVAVPGDILEMNSGRLLINGVNLDYTDADLQPIRDAMGADIQGKVFYIEDLTGKEHIVAYEPGKRALRDFGPLTVPDDKYFMMGDNRDNSADSRYFGFVDRKAIAGKVTGVAVSLDYEDHYKPRWSRFFRKLI